MVCAVALAAIEMLSGLAAHTLNMRAAFLAIEIFRNPPAAKKTFSGLLADYT
jgi:hypothetical protein